MTHLDTHVLAWLYGDELDRLSTAAREHIERDDLAVSPMAILELSYLHELGRRRTDGPTALAALHNEIGIDVDPTPFRDIVDMAQGCTWTRDPFDRIIAAQALAAGAQLLTKDAHLHKYVAGAVW